MNQSTLPIRHHLALVVFIGAALSASIASARECIGTQKSKIYHTQPLRCGSAKRIQGDNRVVFKDAKEAERAGRRQCKRCAQLDAKEDKANADQEQRPLMGGGRPAPRRNTNGRKEGIVPPPTDVSPDVGLPRMVRIKKILPAGTLELESGKRVCFDGVIVPNENQPHAFDARDAIQHESQGRLMRMVQDSHRGVPAGRDGLGRWRVRLAADDGGRDLAGELVYAGYAWLDRSRWTNRWDELSRLEENAWRAGRGIWQQLDGPAGQMKVVTGRGAIAYHEARCDHVKLLTEPREIELNEARARRLVPCEHFRAKAIKRHQVKN